MVRVLKIREFPVDEIPRSCSWTIVAPPGRGKSNLIKYLAYVRRHIYPVIKIHSGTEDSNKSYENWAPKIFINNGYDENQEKDYIMRQKRCLRNGCQNGSAINVIDDCSEDNRIYKSPIYQGLYKNGSRHWNGIVMTALQYGIDFPPAVRSSSMFIALGFVRDFNERDKLYRNFGGLCGSLKDFCSIMDQIIQTKDENGDVKEHQDESDKYTFLIIKRFDASARIEDNIFWLKAPNMKYVDIEFGCNEAWKWDKERRDPDKSLEFI